MAGSTKLDQVFSFLWSVKELTNSTEGVERNRPSALCLLHGAALGLSGFSEVLDEECGCITRRVLDAEESIVRAGFAPSILHLSEWDAVLLGGMAGPITRFFGKAGPYEVRSDGYGIPVFTDQDGGLKKK